MADFLSRLMERSRGAADLARPVVPPLFATGPAVTEGTDGVVTVPSRRSAAEPPAGPPSESGAPGVSRSGAARDVRSEHDVAGSAVAMARATRPSGVAPIPVEVIGPARAPAAASQPTDGGGLMRANATPWSGRGVRPAEMSGVRPPGTVRPRPSPPPDPHRVEPDAAPVIHVTIGRIEVRATPAPAPSRVAAARNTPAVSLEDYLRPRGARR